MKWRKNMVLALVVSLTLGLGGCALLSPDELTEAQMRTWGIEYLEERYDREFEVTGFTWGGVFSNQLNGFYASTPDFPDRGKFSVYWSKGGIKGQFNDMFLYWPMSNEYQMKVNALVTRYFPINHTSTNIRGPHYPSSFNSETTFEEFSAWAKAEPGTNVGTVVATQSTPTEEFDETVALLVTELKALTGTGTLSISLLTPSNYEVWVSTYPTRYTGGGWEISSEIDIWEEWGE